MMDPRIVVMMIWPNPAISKMDCVLDQLHFCVRDAITNGSQCVGIIECRTAMKSPVRRIGKMLKSLMNGFL